MKIFFDLEFTSLEVNNSEIITGYFLPDNNLIDPFNFYSKTNNWSYEAEKIHKITKKEMKAYPDKKDAFNNLKMWLEEINNNYKYDVVLYANPNTPTGFYHIDVAILQFELMNFMQVDRIELQPFQPQNIISVHTLAKQAAKDGYFTPIKGDSGRVSFSQENVFKALFNNSYNAHDAKADVEAMLQIYDELNYRRDNNIINREQLELI